MLHGHGLVSEIESGTPRDGRKSKKVHHTFYNISALRWTFKLIQTVFNYKQCVLGCKKSIVLPLCTPFNNHSRWTYTFLKPELLLFNLHTYIKTYAHTHLCKHTYIIHLYIHVSYTLHKIHTHTHPDIPPPPTHTHITWYSDRINNKKVNFMLDQTLWQLSFNLNERQLLLQCSFSSIHSPCYIWLPSSFVFQHFQ